MYSKVQRDLVSLECDCSIAITIIQNQTTQYFGIQETVFIELVWGFSSFSAEQYLIFQIFQSHK